MFAQVPQAFQHQRLTIRLFPGIILLMLEPFKDYAQVHIR